MDYLTDIKPLEDAGKSGAEMIDILSAITVRSISIDAAKRYFRSAGWWQATPAGYEGKLQVAFNDGTHIASTINVLKALWSAVFTSAAIDLETTMSLQANGVATAQQPADLLFKAFVRIIAKGQIAQGEVAGFYALGGGLKYPSGVTGPQLVAAKNDYLASVAAEETRNQLQQEWAALQNGGINTAVAEGDRAALVTALRAAADSLEGV